MKIHFQINISLTGTQEEIVEQLDLMKEFIASRNTHELLTIKRTDVQCKQIDSPQYEPPTPRTITNQDSTHPNSPHIRGKK